MLVGAFNQEKALVASRGLLRDCTTSPIDHFTALFSAVLSNNALAGGKKVISFVFRSPQCERSRQICKDKDNLSRNDLLHRNIDWAASWHTHYIHYYIHTTWSRVQEVGLWSWIDFVQNRTLHGVCFRVTWCMNHL